MITKKHQINNVLQANGNVHARVDLTIFLKHLMDQLLGVLKDVGSKDLIQVPAPSVTSYVPLTNSQASLSLRFKKINYAFYSESVYICILF